MTFHLKTFNFFILCFLCLASSLLFFSKRRDLFDPLFLLVFHLPALFIVGLQLNLHLLYLLRWSLAHLLQPDLEVKACLGLFTFDFGEEVLQFFNHLVSLRNVRLMILLLFNQNIRKRLNFIFQFGFVHVLALLQNIFILFFHWNQLVLKSRDLCLWKIKLWFKLQSDLGGVTLTNGKFGDFVVFLSGFWLKLRVCCGKLINYWLLLSQRVMLGRLKIEEGASA